MLSIVIPAHNEANVIGRCLAAITAGVLPGELEVIVVCNGCTDGTADIARTAHPDVRVIETDVPSKSNALNLGDRAATAFPRFFVDADVVMPLASVRRVAGVLQEGRALAAAPLMDVDLSHASWSVRAFYTTWLRLPYCRSGMIGSGVYAVSEAGRRRFDRFPAVTADDAFVRLHFSASERVTLQDCGFKITAPRTLSGLIKIKTRAHFGNMELKATHPELWSHEEVDHGSALKRLTLRPTCWPALAVYFSVRLAARAKARWRYRFGDHRKWERDDSSRQPIAAANPERA